MNEDEKLAATTIIATLKAACAEEKERADRAEAEAKRLRTLVADHRIAYIDGEDLELASKVLYEAAGFGPTLGSADELRAEIKEELDEKLGRARP